MIDRTPKPCHHPKARHQHGDLYAYTRDNCRCFRCSLAHSEYRQQLAQAAERNLPSTYVPAEPARRHVQALRNAGWGMPRIVKETGVSRGTMVRLVYGYGGRPRSVMVSRSVHRRIMAVALPELGDLPYVPTIGVQRRLEALATLGWSGAAVARVAGIDVKTPREAVQQGKCLPGTYRALCEAYDKLWDRPPPTDTPAQRTVVNRTKALARRNGWAPPMAWDDESLDDPAAEPDYGQPEPTRAERDAAMRALYDQGLNDAQIGERVGRSRDTVRHWRERRGLPAIDPTAVALGDERDDRLALWQQGLTDREIADRIGRHPDVVRRWRNRHGLESRTNRKRKEAA